MGGFGWILFKKGPDPGSYFKSWTILSRRRIYVEEVEAVESARCLFIGTRSPECWIFSSKVVTVVFTTRRSVLAVVVGSTEVVVEIVGIAGFGCS